jgi:3-hydroxyacyl-CoA dehydrogenase/3a,7a,12a-trihydroxy-5b-cholest-24-enoyl-CoA hydratase
LKNAAGDVYEGEPKNGVKATTTMTLNDEDFVKMASGKLNGQQVRIFVHKFQPTLIQAFMSGKLKIKGNIMLSQKIGQIFDQEKSKL